MYKPTEKVLFNYDHKIGRKDDIRGMHNKDCSWLYLKSNGELRKEQLTRMKENYISENIEKINALEGDIFIDIEMKE